MLFLQGGKRSLGTAACTRHPGPPVYAHARGSAHGKGSARRVLESTACKASLPKSRCKASFPAGDLAPWSPSFSRWHLCFPGWVIISSLCPGSRLKSQQGRFKLNIWRIIYLKIPGREADEVSCWGPPQASFLCVLLWTCCTGTCAACKVKPRV